MSNNLQPYKIVVGSDNDVIYEDPILGSNGTAVVTKINALIDALGVGFSGVEPAGKGYLVTKDGSNNIAQLPPGTNRWCLVASSISPRGLAYEERVDLDSEQSIGGNKTFTGLTNMARLNVTGPARFDSPMTAHDISARSVIADGTLLVRQATQLQSGLTVAGPTTIQNSIDVMGNSLIRSNLTVGQGATISGNTALGGTLAVVGATNLASSLAVQGSTNLVGAVVTGAALSVGQNLSVTGGANLAGSTLIGGSLTVEGPSLINDNLTVTGVLSTEDLNVLDDLHVTGRLTVGRTITATGDINGSANLRISGSTTTSSLTVSDNASIGRNLSVSGNVTTQGNTTIAGDLSAAGVTDLSRLSVRGDTDIDGQLDVDGLLDVGGNIRAAGTVIVAADLHVQGITDLTGNTQIKGMLDVDSSTIIGGSLEVDYASHLHGPVTLGNSLQVDGSLTVDSNALIDDDLVVRGTITTEDLLVNDDLSVVGHLSSASLTTGNTTINGDTQLMGALSVSGPTTMGSTLSVTGNTNLQRNLTVGLNITALGDITGNNLSGINTGDEEPATPTTYGLVKIDTLSADPIVYLKSTIDSNFIPMNQRGVANGVASLDSTGKIPNSQLPSISITDTYVVSSESQMLALGVEVGDVAIRTDINRTYILKSSPSSQLANWELILTPDAPVVSVFGRTGEVVSSVGDYTANQVLYTASPSGIPGVTNVHEALEGLNLIIGQHVERLDNPHGVTASQVGAIAITARGVANGVASLDSTGRVPRSQLPDDIGSYTLNFTADSLVNGELVVNHNLGKKRLSSVIVWSNTDRVVIPDDVLAQTDNTLIVSLVSYNEPNPINGLWTISILK